MAKSKVAPTPVADAAPGMNDAALRSFVKLLREVGNERREILGALRSALEARDDAAALRLARRLAGLPEERRG
jgi:hypothetical protein